MLNINKASRTICNGICQKSKQLQFAEIRKMVSVDPAWNILTCPSQNVDEEMSKLVAVKIIQTYTHEEAVLKSILVVSLDNSSMLLHSGQFRVENWTLLLACALVRVFLRLFIKKIQWTRSGQASLQVWF